MPNDPKLIVHVTPENDEQVERYRRLFAGACDELHVHLSNDLVVSFAKSVQMDAFLKEIEMELKNELPENRSQST